MRGVAAILVRNWSHFGGMAPTLVKRYLLEQPSCVAKGDAPNAPPNAFLLRLKAGEFAPHPWPSTLLSAEPPATGVGTHLLGPPTVGKVDLDQQKRDLGGAGKRPPRGAHRRNSGTGQ